MKRYIRIAVILLGISLSLACQSQNRAQTVSGLAICSPLNFSAVSWPTSLNLFQEQALELALNISGSYEGSTGWVNLTNNFDGQGLSMGLLNQNLGQGSLQPLLLEMKNNHLDKLQTIFSSTHLQSLLGMLSAWETASAATLVGSSVPVLSVTDLSSTLGANTLSTAVSGSVQWAASNLYSGSSFISSWYLELTALGQSPEFISIQVEASLALHDQALTDMAPLQVPELRTYLMVFDIEVQDGGIYPQDFTDYSTWLGQNPQSSNTARLKEILTLRLRHVASQYVADVQSRKLAIINGSGVVHQESRNLEQQYCFNRLTPDSAN